MNRGTFLGAAAVIGANPAIPITPPIFTPTLRIAAVCPMSGEDKVVGMELLRGIRAAIDYLNDQRASYQSFLICDTYDDRNVASDATVKSSFAVGNQQCLAVIGHLSAAATLVAEPVYSQATMPLIVPTVTDDRITALGYQNVFRLPIKDSDEGGLVAAYVIAAGAKAPYVVSVDGVGYGPAVAAGFVRRAAALRVNANASAIPAEKPDYAAAAGAIVARLPDFVVLAGNVEDLGPLLSALRASGFTGRFIGTQGFFDAQTASAYAKVADGMVVSSAAPYYPLAPSTTMDVREYVTHNGPLTPVAAYGYAAVQLLTLAQQRTGATSRIQMLRALANGGSYTTLTGLYTFSPTGDVVDPNCYFYVLKDGKFSYERQARRTGFMLR
jgi:branched-chain amino acid transport system substrate-binding protein